MYWQNNYNNNLDINTNHISTKRIQTINTFRTLWFEHVMWTRSFLTGTAFDTKDLDASTKRLLQNPKDFAKVLKPFYGEQKANQFEKLLTEHLSIAADFVNAAKAGDTKKADELRVKWYANADEIATFLASINPYWSAKTWQALLYDHLKMTENEAVDLLTGKYEESVVEFDRIEAEAMKMADYMAQGIISQFRL